MTKKYLLFHLVGLLSWASLAQNYTISGYVEEEKSRERLIGVNIFTPDKRIGTSTNNYGFFSITVPSYTQELIFTYLGFETVVYQSAGIKDQVITIRMIESSNMLQEVVVIDETKPIAEQTQMSAVEINIKQIKSIPALFGEVDVLRAIQYLPGVQSGGEGTTGLYVRGGGPDQNLVLLDGVPVYNVSHLFGFFSVFNADAIKSIQLIKGGFPARYGGRLSSVLDISMKEGNMQELHGEGSIGLIASKLTLEGPIIKDKTSFMISGRRTYLDVLAQPIIAAAEPGSTFGYYFTDLNLKINHKFSDKDRLYLSYFTGFDKFYLRYKETWLGNTDEFRANMKWGNGTASLRWNHLFNPKLFMNIAATYTRYQLGIQSSEVYYYPEGKEEYGFKLVSNIRDLGLKADFEYVYNPKNHIRFGANTIFHGFTPGAVSVLIDTPDEKLDSIINLAPRINSIETYAYIENDQHITRRLAINYGLHFVHYHIRNKDYFSLQPRVSGRYLLSDNLSVKASYARMVQYLHLLSGNNGIGLPSDLWVPATDLVPPMTSDQVAAGFAFSTPDGFWEFSIEGYYKYMNGLVEYGAGTSFVNPNNWENNVVIGGQGWAYGSEFFIQRKLGKSTGWVGYTLSWNNRQFDDLNNGEVYPYRFDRRHDISIVFLHTFSERLDVGFTWVYGTGVATNIPMFITSGLPPLNYYNPFEIYENFGSRNSFRMPAYHRADIGINFHRNTKWGKRTWNVSLYNMYNRQNPFFLFMDYDWFRQQRVIKQVSLFPIIPSISYIFKF